MPDTRISCAAKAKSPKFKRAAKPLPNGLTVRDEKSRRGPELENEERRQGKRRHHKAGSPNIELFVAQLWPATARAVSWPMSIDISYPLFRISVESGNCYLFYAFAKKGVSAANSMWTAWIIGTRHGAVCNWQKRQRRQDGFQRGTGDMIFGKEGLLHAIIGVLLALLILGFLYRMGID
jgi:hypothetical protein